MAKNLNKKILWGIGIALVIAAFAAGYYYASHSHGFQTPTLTTTADTLTLPALPLHSQDVVFTKKYIGYVEPIYEAKIQPFINGFIDKVFVKGGQYVRKGDLLLLLEQDLYKAQLAAANADILKAKANLTNAQLYYDRLNKAGNKAVSPTDLDNAKAQLLTAKAQLEQAVANYQSAEVNYKYTIIRSPIDGIVGNISLTPGNYVSPASEPLLSIIQYNPLRVVFSITDKEYLNELKNGRPFAQDTISLQLPDGSVFPNYGIFKYADNAINKSTNSVAVYADFKNIGKTLVPNAYVSVLLKQTFKNTVLISKDLLSMERDGNYIFIIRNSKLLKEKVNVIASENTDFIVENSFQKGDFILTIKPQAEFFKKNIIPQDTSEHKNPSKDGEKS